MNINVLALLLLGLTATGACAAPALNDAAATPTASEAPAEAAAWLELQRAGNYAGKPNPLPGDAAARAYDRYLKSFETPIPERFETGGSSWK